MKSKQKKPVFSIILYVSAGVIAILGTALLISNILLYSNNVTQYIAQGYSVDTVTAQLVPSQLIPGVLEPVCLYYGMALLLAAAGIINTKFTKLIAASPEADTTEVVQAEIAQQSEEPAAEESTVQPEEAEHKTEIIDDEEIIDECNSSVEDNK